MKYLFLNNLLSRFDSMKKITIRMKVIAGLLALVAVSVLGVTVYFLRFPLDYARFWAPGDHGQRVYETDAVATQEDLLLLSRYVVEHLDFSSAMGVKNVTALLPLAEGRLAMELERIRGTVSQHMDQSERERVINFFRSGVVAFDESSQLYKVTVSYIQYSSFKDGTTQENENQVVLYFKPVGGAASVSLLPSSPGYLGVMWVEVTPSLSTF